MSSSSSSLEPPRPFFIQGSHNHNDRASPVSSESSSIDLASDSDRDQPPPPPTASARIRQARRRSAMAATSTSHSHSPSTAASAADMSQESNTDSGTWSPTSIYSDSGTTRPPPSSFLYPFQAYPGNPDPLPVISRRRSSLESMQQAALRSYYALGLVQDPPGSQNALPDITTTFQRPYAPFMAGSKSSTSVYRNSAAANATPGQPADIPRSPSQTFRAPFLAPSSRPGSSLWSPPAPAYPLSSSPSQSNANLPLPLRSKVKAPLPSTRLPEKIDKEEKPWLADREPRTRASWWITFLCIVLGIAGAALLCWIGITDINQRILTDSDLCLVLDEQWSQGLDTNRWKREVELGGFGNGEFQMTTGSDKNSYVQDGQLYIFPTLTSDEVPDYLTDGKTYKLDGCTGVDVAPPPPPANTTGGHNSTTTGGRNNTTTGGNANGGNANGGNANRGNANGGNANGGNTNGGNGRGAAGGGATTGNNGDETDPNADAGTGNVKRWLASITQPPVKRGAGGGTAGGGPTRNGNTSACSASTSNSRGTVINPVMSARLTTKGTASIKYGRVEVKAKIPRGDWLWPAIWMLPEESVYGAWPLSGEIDILEGRGNGPSYPAQGTNYVRSSLNYGLASGLTPIVQIDGKKDGLSLTKQLYGWFSLKRSSFDRAFHTYAIEWDEKFVRFYVDNRVQTTLEVAMAGKGGKGFWERGAFPPTAQNGSDAAVVVTNPWEGKGPSAPFDQKFYLIINLSVGGTSGWFPDEMGDKPWHDASLTAMRDFAKAQDKWYSTWPQSPQDRAFRIDSVKMWSKGCQ